MTVNTFKALSEYAIEKHVIAFSAYTRGDRNTFKRAALISAAVTGKIDVRNEGG